MKKIILLTLVVFSTTVSGIKRTSEMAGINKNEQEINEQLYEAIAFRIHAFEKIKDLIEKGADVNFLRKGQLMLNKISNQPDILKLFIENGANVNSTDANGDTPLHILMKLRTRYGVPLAEAQSPNKQNNDTYRSAELLVNNGANINTQNTQGNTPLMELFLSIKQFNRIGDKDFSISNIPGLLPLVTLFLDTKKKPLPGISNIAKSYLIAPYASPNSKTYLQMLPADLRRHIAQQTGLDLTLKNKEYKNTLRLAREAQASLRNENERQQFQPIIDLLDEATQKSITQSPTHD